MLLMATRGMSAGTACVLPPSGPALITADCVDDKWNNIIIDSQSDEISPAAHRKVAGHFDNTTTHVNIYLPTKAQWRGHFFHYVYPTASENADNDTLGFALDSGAYLIQITGTLGYRADAAAAKFSRQVASKYYGITLHIYGYLFGGSGGSYQTIGGIENTEGVWDGAVAFIQGVPESNPPTLSVRALVSHVLKHKASSIIDAVRPGGSSDPYAGLTALQADVFREATSLGVPIESWEDWNWVAGTRSLQLLNQSYRSVDPSYIDDFWLLPGYEGTEQSELGDFLRSALVNHTTMIERFIPAEPSSPATIVLADLPVISDPLGLDFRIYDQAGSFLGLLWGNLDVESRTVNLYDASNETTVSALAPGLEVILDNRLYLAMSLYHRHQLPSRNGFFTFDQFRDASGKPMYTQRDVILAEKFAESSSGGGTHTGNISTKLIIVDNLLDSDAYPWHAIWYRKQVEDSLGSSFDDNYRLWFNEHANHDYDVTEVSGPIGTQRVAFRGTIQYALRELADWVQNGVLPASNTNYTLSDSQVSVAGTAAERHGIQPVAKLMVNGAEKAEVAVGEVVSFKVLIEIPMGSSKIVAVE
ncbi:uncharacterized protein CTRU02_214317 [Colletotrichum truncatum]|uniref:Uncharacterized protein n=1 Tax=Colletotrichum truncatum TaxID=5467 RepID=A0ACC3YI44_COLTU|nr:uncharacterized protein CTRU02_11392 [Colletotrichum truncatum]KAF6786134.1 hypothetical protein CTRU02_11392 [Colletotrichum truncatum]